MKATDQTQFNNIYWAHQNHDVQTLRSITDPGLRFNRAVELATKGNVIDTQIHAENLDPFTEMVDRVADGYTWVPNILQVPIPEAPGVNNAGGTPYDPNNPPPGSVRVSIEIGDAGKTSWGDYPPFDPAPPQAPPPGSSSLVGVLLGGRAIDGRPLWIALGIAGPDGTVYTDPLGRGTYIFHRIAWPFGYQMYFTRLSDPVQTVV